MDGGCLERITQDCHAGLRINAVRRLCWQRSEHEFDEADAATYLGPASRGPQLYTVRCSVKDLKDTHNLRCYNEDEACEMLFCPNWSGLGVLTSGYEGSSVEPFHAPWEKDRQEIAVLATRQSSLEVLHQMQ